MVWLCFLLFLAACGPAAASGRLFPPGDWYARLSKPDWTPPGWVFPVAWTTLYLCISAAGARAAVAEDNALAMALWALQITLNTLWTPVFFGLHRLRLALGVLAALWLAAAAAMLALWAVDTLAGLLFVPYLAWLTLAGALNRAVLRRNPELADGAAGAPS